MQVEKEVSLEMLLTTYETDTSQTGVCIGRIRSWYSFAQTEKNIPLSNLFNRAAFFEMS